VKKWTSVLAVLMAAPMVTASVCAAGDEKSKSPISSDGATGATDEKAKSKSDSPAVSPSMSGSGDFTGRHTMEGEVTSVDAKKGHLTLKTAEGAMTLHFPASALESVKKGDRISVELALKPAGAASSGASAPSASPKMDKDKTGGSGSQSGGSGSSGEKKY
jgi:hypothetical protein